VWGDKDLRSNKSDSTHCALSESVSQMLGYVFFLQRAGKEDRYMAKI